MENTQWQSLLKLGNECFHNKQWDQAKFFYSEAYDLLFHFYQKEPMSSDLLMAWVCTCHNLSSLYETIGQLDLSLKFLMLPHEYLKGMSESSTLNDDIQLIAFKGMTLTLTPILLFAKKYPLCDGCLSNLTNLKKLMEADLKAIH